MWETYISNRDCESWDSNSCADEDAVFWCRTPFKLVNKYSAVEELAASIFTWTHCCMPGDQNCRSWTLNFQLALLFQEKVPYEFIMVVCMCACTRAPLNVCYHPLTFNWAISCYKILYKCSAVGDHSHIMCCVIATWGTRVTLVPVNNGAMSYGTVDLHKRFLMQFYL